MKSAAKWTILWVLAAFLLVAQTTDDDRARVNRTLQDASRALLAGDAASFLSYFDRKKFSDYPRLESNVVALTRQVEIASSARIVELARAGDAFDVKVDWLLQLRPLSAPGPIETKKQTLSLRLRLVKKKWKVEHLEPVDFFRPG